MLDLSVNACYNYFKDFVALVFPDRIFRRQIHFSALAALGQYRTELVTQMRSQIFRQIV